MWRCLAIQELFDNDSSRCMWRLSWCDYDLVGSRDDDRGSRSAFGEVLSWCLTLLTTVRSVYDDYVYSEFLYLSAWFLLEFISVAAQSNQSPWHWTRWLQWLLCIQHSSVGLTLDPRVPFASRCDKFWMPLQISVYHSCQVERLVSSLGHPALLLKESFEIWPCLATYAYIYLAHDCVMYEQGVIWLWIILLPELIHDPMMVRLV